ncbi:MAG: hypothetical protein ACPG8W_12315 [Candidatus Promineifilaceae bacterium]
MKVKNTKKMYEAPVIVYEGRISTRAGSTRSNDGGNGGGGVDVFSNDN